MTAAIWTSRRDSQGHKLWELGTMERQPVTLANVQYAGEGQWRLSIAWDGKTTWALVRSTTTARRYIINWLNRSSWSPPEIIA